MKKSNIGKRLLAVVTAVILSLGCFQTAFAAYKLTAEDKAALNLNKFFLSSISREDHVSKVTLDQTDDDIKEMIRRFHGSYSKRQLFKAFGVSGDIDDDIGTTVSIRTTGLKKSTKITVVQYDMDEKKWRSLSARMIDDGLLDIYRIKSTDPIIITVPASEKNMVKSVTVSPRFKSLNPTKTATLKATYRGGIAGQTPTWKITSGKSYVSLSATKGKTVTVKAKKAGTAKITASVGGKKGTCTIRVNRVKVSKVKLDQKNLELAPADTAKLKASVVPSYASNTGIKWKSSNTNLATVSSKGVVTIKKGATIGKTVTITATSKESTSKYARCKITIIAKQ